MAKKIASYDPIAVRSAKEAVVRGMDLRLSEGLELEKRLASELSLRKCSGARVEIGGSNEYHGLSKHSQCHLP